MSESSDVVGIPGVLAMTLTIIPPNSALGDCRNATQLKARSALQSRQPPLLIAIRLCRAQHEPSFSSESRELQFINDPMQSASSELL